MKDQRQRAALFGARGGEWHGGTAWHDHWRAPEVIHLPLVPASACLEITREQSLHPFFILNDHYHADSFHAESGAPSRRIIVMNAGALQPFAVRQLAARLPPCPPKINVRHDGPC